MKHNLNDYDQKVLQSIYEPRFVAVPPQDAWNTVCVTDDGEIRVYGQEGRKNSADTGKRIYIASRDCGLSWKTYPENENALGQAIKSPYSARWLRLLYTHSFIFPKPARRGRRNICGDK